MITPLGLGAGNELKSGKIIFIGMYTNASTDNAQNEIVIEIIDGRSKFCWAR